MRTTQLVILVLLTLTLEAALLGAPVWEQFATSDGLISNDVGAFFEASDGSIWMGTTGRGLNQYVDGKILTWDSGTDWVPVQVYGICDGAAGRIWACAVDQGCVYLENGVWEEGFHLTDPFWGIHAKGGVKRGADGRLWGGFSPGIMYYDPLSGAGRQVWWSSPPPDGHYSDSDPHDLFIDSTGAIWLMFGWGIMIKMDQDGNIIRTFPDRCGRVAEGPDGTIWLGEWPDSYLFNSSGVDRLEGDEFVSVSPPAGSFPAEPLGPICAADSGEIVTGCYNPNNDSFGVFTYDGAEWRYWESPIQSSCWTMPIYSLTVDRHGDIWAGTANIDSGVWVLRRNQEQSDVVVALSTNAAQYTAGDLMRVFLDISSAQTKTVDLYVAIQLPSGDVLFYPGLGASWSAFWPGLLLPAGTDAKGYQLFSLALPDISEGTYRWYAACMYAGTMEFASNIASCEWSFTK